MNTTSDVRPAWMAAALCAQCDPDVFHPDPNDAYRAAVRVCNKCPVRQACLDYAIANDEREGIWGGHTPAARRRIAAGLPPNARPLKPCGTPAAYQRHLENREPTCDACRAVKNAAVIARRTKAAS